MGWNSAGDIIEPFLRELVALDKMYPEDELGKKTVPAIVALIGALKGRGWDCGEEALGAFSHVPWIVAAFEACGVTLTCHGTCEDCGEICGKERL